VCTRTLGDMVYELAFLMQRDGLICGSKILLGEMDEMGMLM
jgi:hypothetical protein